MPLIQVHLTRDVFDACHDEIGQAIHEAQISQKKLRSDLERSGRDEARQVLDRVTKSIEERHLKRGRAP